MTDIAVLFARADSIYKTIPGCDVYDMERDALTYTGTGPVIAHPPCRAWGELSHMASPRNGERDLAPWAVDLIRKNGGVLEHPARSKLWPAKNLPQPGERDQFGGWTFPIFQHWFGHRARKSTYLYIVGLMPADLPDFPLVLGEASHIIGSSGRRKDGSRKCKGREVTKAEREHTPPALATWLYQLATKCKAGRPEQETERAEGKTDPAGATRQN